MMHWLKSDWCLGILPSSDDIDIQVPERNSVIDLSDWYFKILANSWEKLNSLHQGVAWHDENC